MGACARNMQSDPAEIKPAQCCIKLVFHLTEVHSFNGTRKVHILTGQGITLCFCYSKRYPRKHEVHPHRCQNFKSNNTRVLCILNSYVYDSANLPTEMCTYQDYILRVKSAVRPSETMTHSCVGSQDNLGALASSSLKGLSRPAM